MSFAFGLLIAIVVFSSASEGGSYIHTMRDEEQDRIKDFLTSNFNIPVAYRTRLQKSAYLKFADCGKDFLQALRVICCIKKENREER